MVLIIRWLAVLPNKPFAAAEKTLFQLKRHASARAIYVGVRLFCFPNPFQLSFPSPSPPPLAELELRMFLPRVYLTFMDDHCHSRRKKREEKQTNKQDFSQFLSWVSGERFPPNVMHMFIALNIYEYETRSRRGKKLLRFVWSCWEVPPPEQNTGKVKAARELELHSLLDISLFFQNEVKEGGNFPHPMEQSILQAVLSDMWWGVRENSPFLTVIMNPAWPPHA